MIADEPLEPRLRELLGGIAAVRVLVVAWSLAVVGIDSRSGVLDHRTAAFALLAVLVAWTGTFGMWAATSPARLVRRPVMAVDLALGVTIAAADWFVYEGPHPQSFGSSWPATAVAVTGIVAGWRPGLIAGLTVGMANIIGAVWVDRLDGRGLALSGTVVLLATIGAVVGWVSQRLRAAESEVAAARERERFARTLHDGVLQTLAVVQRRSDDDELVSLARDQEWELRHFIGSGATIRTAPSDLISELRAVAARVERMHRQRVEVVVIETPDTSGPELEAIVGAAAEAATNAAKHASAQRITFCVDSVEPHGGTTVTVVDDGCGFDTEASYPGAGLDTSIRSRMSDVGGTARISSTIGRGTEVELWLP